MAIFAIALLHSHQPKCYEVENRNRVMALFYCFRIYFTQFRVDAFVFVGLRLWAEASWIIFLENSLTCLIHCISQRETCLAFGLSWNSWDRTDSEIKLIKNKILNLYKRNNKVLPIIEKNGSCLFEVSYSLTLTCPYIFISVLYLLSLVDHYFLPHMKKEISNPNQGKLIAEKTGKYWNHFRVSVFEISTLYSNGLRVLRIVSL